MPTPTISVIHDTGNQGLLIGNGNPVDLGINPASYLTSTSVNVVYLDSSTPSQFVPWKWDQGSLRWVPGGSGAWIKVGTFTFANFSLSATLNTISTGYTIPADAPPMACYIRLNTAFVGGGIGTYKVSVGTSTLPAKYHADLNVHTIPPSPIQPQARIGIEVASTALTLTATCSGDTLDNASAGEFDLFIYMTSLPA